MKMSMPDISGISIKYIWVEGVGLTVDMGINSDKINKRQYF